MSFNAALDLGWDWVRLTVLLEGAYWFRLGWCADSGMPRMDRWPR